MQRINARIWTTFTIIFLCCHIVDINAQGEGHDISLYNPGSWWPGTGLDDVPSLPMPLPNDKPFNETWIDRSTTLPVLCYPMRPAAIVGINDTITFYIDFYNPTSTEFSFGGSNPEKWFVPQVYDVNTNIYEANPFMDTTLIKFRVRGWLSSYTGKPLSKPAKLVAKSQEYRMYVDVWKLPQGLWMLVAAPTSAIPLGFYARKEGGAFEYRAGVDLADTINAFEAHYWRAETDVKDSVSLAWTDSMLAHHPNSVPAYWLRARCLERLGDSLGVVESYTKAIYRFDNHLDNWLPDATGGLHPAEAAYLNMLKVRLPQELEDYIHPKHYRY